MWVFTVASLMNSCAAISGLLSPRAISRSTSVSRAVRRSVSLVGGSGVSPATSRLVTSGSNVDWPAAVDRSAAPHYRIVNAGTQELRGVTVSIAGASDVRVSSPASIRPGEAVRADLVPGPSRDTLLVLRWFPPDGREYLWQISF